MIALLEMLRSAVHQIDDLVQKRNRQVPGQADQIRFKLKTLACWSGCIAVCISRYQPSKHRQAYFRHDETMAWMFLSAGLALLVVTAIGLCGLASFWVRRRYQQIGIRRALGARKADIVTYFLLENLILTLAGSTVGTVLAVGINQLVSQRYAVGRIEAPFLLGAVVAVIVLGQLAAFFPARKAVSEVPVAVLRSS